MFVPADRLAGWPVGNQRQSHCARCWPAAGDQWRGVAAEWMKRARHQLRRYALHCGSERRVSRVIVAENGRTSVVRFLLASSMPCNVAACNSSGYNYASGRLDHQTYYKSIRVDQAQMGVVVLDRVLRAHGSTRRFSSRNFFAVERTWRNICAVRNVSDFKTVFRHQQVNGQGCSVEDAVLSDV